jgi:hypothetical protein
MPSEGFKSISLWSEHAKAIEEYTKTLPYPPTIPQLVKRAVSLKAVPIKKLLGSQAIKTAILTINEADEGRLVLKSVTVPDKVAEALAEVVKSAKDDIKDYLGMSKEPSPTFCAGVYILLFIETESPGFLTRCLRYKKKELFAVG